MPAEELDHHSHLHHSVEHNWTDIWLFSLAVSWVPFNTAPDSIHEFVSSSCKTFECTTNHLGCVAVNLLCIDLCGCTICKKNDSQKLVDVDEIFNNDDDDDDDDDDDFGEYQDEHTDGEADDSNDSSEDKLFKIMMK